MATATSPGAQTQRRGGAGPVRGLLGGKTSPAALVFLLFRWDGFANRPALPDGSQNRPTLQPPSKIAGWDDFAAGARDQGGQDVDTHAGLQEMHRAVGEHGVGPAGVEAVDFAVIRAIDGALAVKI